MWFDVGSTGTNSMRKILKPYSDTQVDLKPSYRANVVSHEPHHVARWGIATDLDFDKYFKFCFFRNPWDVMVSKFCLLLGYDPVMMYGGANFVDRNKCDRYDDFEEWIQIPGVLVSHYESKSRMRDFAFDPQTGLQYVDKIYDFERLEESWADVDRRIGLGGARLPHHNKSRTKKSHYSTYYKTSKSIELVREFYEVEIDMFGYKFEKL